MRYFLSLVVILFAAAFADAQPAKDKPKGQPFRGHGYVAPSKEISAARHAASDKKHGERLARLRPATAATYDCRATGQDTGVQDQGGCGDCYLFSAAEVCECAQLTANIVSIKTDPNFHLSVQWLLDYHPELGGCNGGDEWQVAQVILQSGIPSLAQYPGAGQSPGKPGTFVGAPFKISDMGYCTVSAGPNSVANTQDIKNCMVQYGPISVAVAAGTWTDPGSGIITGNDTNVDHAILLVGWDDTKGWIAKNQWSTQWGNQGYFWIGYGADSVGTEAFWVAAQPLPPLPPAPVPPAPVPPTPIPPVPGIGLQIVVPQDTPAGTYNLVTPTQIAALDAQIKALQGTLGAIRDRRIDPAPIAKPLPQPPAQRTDPTIEARVTALESGLADNKAALMSILDMLDKRLPKK